jgi:tetratricopeptide (TPR) repeat protein
MVVVVVGGGIANADDGAGSGTASPVNDQLGQPASADAEAHLTQGNAFYRLGEFEKAIDEYKAGALIEGAGVFQFNIAQAYRQLRNYEKAIFHYRRFLALRQPTGELRSTIDGFLATMQAELDGAAAKQEPTGPGPVTTEVRDEARHSWATPRRKIALGVAAVGAVALAGGVVFGVLANRSQEKAEQICPTDVCDRAAEANAHLEDGNTRATYANVAFGVGAAAAIGAAVLWFTGAPASHDVAVFPRAGRSFAGVDVEVRF